jgi:hypothetical protein
MLRFFVGLRLVLERNLHFLDSFKFDRFEDKKTKKRPSDGLLDDLMNTANFALPLTGNKDK